MPSPFVPGKTRVRCVFKGSQYFGKFGTVADLEKDRVVVTWDSDNRTATYRAASLQIIYPPQPNREPFSDNLITRGSRVFRVKKFHLPATPNRPHA